MVAEAQTRLAVVVAIRLAVVATHLVAVVEQVAIRLVEAVVEQVAIHLVAVVERRRSVVVAGPAEVDSALFCDCVTGKRGP